MTLLGIATTTTTAAAADTHHPSDRRGRSSLFRRRNNSGRGGGGDSTRGCHYVYVVNVVLAYHIVSKICSNGVDTALSLSLLCESVCLCSTQGGKLWRKSPILTLGYPYVRQLQLFHRSLDHTRCNSDPDSTTKPPAVFPLSTKKHKTRSTNVTQQMTS